MRKIKTAQILYSNLPCTADPEIKLIDLPFLNDEQIADKHMVKSNPRKRQLRKTNNAITNSSKRQSQANCLPNEPPGLTGIEVLNVSPQSKYFLKHNLIRL